ncbi:MAG TPA: hypothetical protein VNV42_11795 [Solirubrobacteraceae bacterium]|jgi:hypothetical protein|nr:hypothetical protein [Solirubrobacteraceae bacterium]
MRNSITRLAPWAACGTLALSALLAPPALATHFQSESYAGLLAQLHKREIVAIVLHPSGPVAHASARNGQHFTVAYTQAEVAPLRVAAGAGGSSFAISAAQPKSKAVHHKLRYIAGGVLIVVIVVVLLVLLLGRRRAIEEEGPGEGGAASASPPAGSG